MGRSRHARVAIVGANQSAPVTTDDMGRFDSRTRHPAIYADQLSWFQEPHLRVLKCQRGRLSALRRSCCFHGNCDGGYPRGVVPGGHDIFLNHDYHKWRDDPEVADTLNGFVNFSNAILISLLKVTIKTSFARGKPAGTFLFPARHQRRFVFIRVCAKRQHPISASD